MTISFTSAPRPWHVACVVALATASAPAVAQTDPKKEEPPQPTCPPGAFCEEPPEAEPPEAGPGAASPSEEDPAAREPRADDEGEPVTIVLPPTDDPNTPRTFTYRPDPAGGPGQVIVYEGDDGPALLEEEEEEEEGGVGRAPRTRVRQHRERLQPHRRWGLNLRMEGVLMPQYRDGVANETGMAGLGLSLRYRPTPMFAFDFGADFLTGTDTNGFSRQELPLALSLMIYANPQSVAQFYVFGGINGSFARVSSRQYEVTVAERDHDAYSYVGGHGGVGFEIRVSELIGINLDGLVLARTRTDDDGQGAFPEFYDPDTGTTSNSSAAGLLRGGVTFWW